jgi:hypothetical protein
MRPRHTWTALTLAVALFPASAASQTTFSIYSRNGLLAPDAYFYEVYSSFVENAAWTSGSLGRSFVTGLGVELGFEGTGIKFRGEVLRSFEGWLRISDNRIVGRQLFNPPYITTAWYDAAYTMTLTSFQVVLPTKLRLWGVQPYVTVGGGGKFYDFGETTEENTTEALVPKDGFTWGGDLGAGLLLHLFGGVTVDLQARDAITKYWGKLENDFIYSGALVIRLH